MKLILLGAPGAGKGTVAEKLVDNCKMGHLSTGEMFRSEVKSGSSLGQKLKSILDSGALVPDELTLELVKNRLTSGSEKNLILDGFPRTLVQAEQLLALFPECKAVYLKVDKNVVIKRLSGRRTCPKCAAIYHIEFNPPQKPGQCDNCSTPLIQRSDDSEASIQHRLEVYEQQTSVLIDFFTKKNILFTVNADKDPDQVFQDTKNKILPLLD